MLNSEQRKAVNIIDGPLLILAGAGSGKTHTLTERVVSLIKNEGIAPASILCVTFTNKAAKEMRARIGEKLGIDMSGDINSLYRSRSDLPFVSTFHSMGVFFLRMFIDKLGYEKNFVIYDDSDSRALLSEIIKEKKIDPKDAPVRKVQYEISTAKNGSVSPNTYSAIVDNHFRSLVAEIYPEYERKLKANNGLDFDDILLKTLEILRIPEVLEYFHDRFQYFCVDEYQDTNTVQYEIIALLAKRSQNLCVVGDDWQGIYSWRGANIRNILNFKQDFANAQVIKLEQNYRSTKTIINAANVVVTHNESALDKRMWTDNDEGEKIAIHETLNEKDEAAKVAELISDDYENWTILYRTNSQSRLIEEALIRSGIPYQIYGGVKFYDRKEIKDILAYLRVLYAPRDLISFKRIINTPPRKIGATSYEKIAAFIERQNIDIFEAVNLVESIPDLRNPGKTALIGFLHILEEIRKFAGENNVRKCIDCILEKIGYADYLSENFSPPEVEARVDNINELKNLASRYDNYEPAESLMHFLEDIALVSDSDNVDENLPKVAMMTTHTAKGLEFENVIIVGAEEGLFPHSRSLLELDELEEERRLWYVAMTRAKKKLFITRAKERYSFGNYSANPESRFVDEIPDEYSEKFGGSSMGSVSGMFTMFQTETEFPKLNLDRGAPGQKRESRPENVVGNFNLGDRVEHAKFGVGTIVSIDGENGQIAFVGQIKTMNLRVAPIEKV